MSATNNAVELVRVLSDEIGPRRPCSAAERQAAEHLKRWLAERDISADLQEFRGYASGGYLTGPLLAAALAGADIQRREGWLGWPLIAAAALLGAMEDDLRVTPLSDLISRESSQNLVASVGPVGEQRQRICLCGHMDSTRSGLIFHPSLQRYLPALFAIPGASMGALLVSPVAPRRLRRLLRGVARAGLALGLVLAVERELRGSDVPGANDNASGTAVAMQLFSELAAKPLQHTRVDLLITGCEEAWMLGSRAYVRDLEREQPNGAQRPIFINFDTVGADVPLTYILEEGTVKTRPASSRLIALLKEIAASRPELGLRAAEHTAGLPTDATPAMAHGYEAVTLLAKGDEGIPNYHWPTDTYENIEPRTIETTLEVGRELVAALEAAT